MESTYFYGPIIVMHIMGSYLGKVYRKEAARDGNLRFAS